MTNFFAGIATKSHWWNRYWTLCCANYKICQQPDSDDLKRSKEQQQGIGSKFEIATSPVDTEFYSANTEKK
jgi:hypothetical protein